ncbi:hypothetical protein B1F70_27645, partial [Pseudomonas syringae]
RRHWVGGKHDADVYLRHTRTPTPACASGVPQLNRHNLIPRGLFAAAGTKPVFHREGVPS